MKNRTHRLHPILRFFLIIPLMLLTNLSTHADTFLEEFKKPDPWYHSAPLWVWNDDVTEEKIEQDLEMLKSQGVLQAFVHPRPGLITPYLSEEWVNLYGFAVKTAKEKGMLLHIYDENSYPSGFAGGHVYRQHPEWAGKGMVLESVDQLPDALSEDVIAVYRKEGDSVSRLEEPPLGESGQFLIAKIVHAEKRAWTAGGPYVDLLEPGLTEAFLEITYEPYRKKFGEEFGKTVRGAFTDEPHLVPAGKVHWTPRLPQLFEDRYGYALADVIPSLFQDVGDYKKVRFDFNQLLLDEFIERWSKPYHDYCEKYGLLYTGHYWEHGWPGVSHGPDNMAMYAFHQMPAIDCLMNRYSEDVHAQFGNVRAVIELSSIANQLGMERRLCEVYGAGGWEMSFADQKRIADWLGVLGVNLFNQHLTYMTIRGARKRDHPLSFSDHEPWWDQYHVLGEYLGRLAYALSQGQERKKVLVLEPTTTGWSLERADGPKDELEAMGAAFQAFITNLSLNQVEYDLGSERTIRDHGRIEDGKFIVGDRAYDLLVLHRTCENLCQSTADLIETYVNEGGLMLLVGGAPTSVDGKENSNLAKIFPNPPDEGQSLLTKDGNKSSTIDSEEKVIDFLQSEYASIRFPEHRGGKLFHQFRELEDSGLLLLCNTSADETVTGQWTAEGKGVALLNLFTGDSEAAAFTVDGDQVAVTFELPPAGSALYWITSEKSESAKPEKKEYGPVEMELVGIQRLAPNALPLDYLDYEAASESGENTFFFEAQTKIYQAHGLDNDPWDRAVQYEGEILAMDKKFGPDTGFTVAYPFLIEGFDQAPPLSIVVEQPERYQVALNETKEASVSGTADPHFKSLRFEEGVQTGANRLTLIASPFSVHDEVEPVYVMGDFRLESRDKGWAILPPKELDYGSWKDQGLPFYSDAVRYSYQVRRDQEDGSIRLRLTDWNGTLATVSVSGNQVGVLGLPPYEIEMTGLKKGMNEIDIDVYGSLKNLYGPHHGNPELGAAWPSGFLKAPKQGPPPGTEYSVIDYGLFAPPTLEAAKE
ncbi:MAG: hypothetical protein H6751_18010 [Candidatus Omnitrophica bacterium]|nr:hypothetical protein [Candidatus Omnitrophota bacterium]